MRNYLSVSAVVAVTVAGAVGCASSPSVNIPDASERFKPQLASSKVAGSKDIPRTLTIEGGTFQMGCLSGDSDCDSYELPVRQVTLQPFKMAESELTVAQFKAFVDSTGYVSDAEANRGPKGCRKFGGSRWKWSAGTSWKNPGFTQSAADPLVCVSKDDASYYIAWLNDQTGRSFRLPTESEWEYAARANSTTKYHWGDAIGLNNANCFKCSSNRDGRTAPVASFPANAWGLYDMHGNVREWVQDQRYYYKNASLDGGVQTSGSRQSILRGGSWGYIASAVRSAARSTTNKRYRYNDVGIRLAEDI